MDATFEIREAWPKEADASKALVGDAKSPGIYLIAHDETGLRAACHCHASTTTGCEARLGAAPDAEADATWELINRAAGRIVSAGIHRLHVDGDQQIDALWQRAHWGDQPDFTEAKRVVRVMGRR